MRQVRYGAQSFGRAGYGWLRQVRQDWVGYGVARCAQVPFGAVWQVRYVALGTVRSGLAKHGPVG